ncbi:MAG TPA: cytochrome b/b6 domain-containing protein [Ramlibacter sp.]|uniref:cytochrome b/b6 domain-containing protein n=1 Tax=Ramlibacter sp. TaxID=1917967 RepID=UPI002D7F3DE1|nr:cytochrome b/b6 domain-containing protein [Ramlibacter sp.]HET8747823.1 cytochrome b/b6 domain-containing protein [Ramlibacter sp.]
MPHRIRVWDLPTRLFHWLLVGCVVALVVTAKVGGNATEWHARIGHAVLALLLFRLVWGFVGGHWSRFGSFLYAPGSVKAYLAGRAHPDHLVGHSPLGAGAVFAMLAVLLAQAGTGLFVDDEAGFTGPLNRFVSTARGLALTSYHRTVGQWLLFALVALHIAAIVFYERRRRQALVRPMITGDKELAHQAPAARDDAASRTLAAAVALACAGLAAWVSRLG